MKYEQITYRIKCLCKEKKVSVAQMLIEIGLSKSFVYDIEKRETYPSCDKMCKIADYLEVSVDYLLGRTDEPSKQPTNSIVNTNSNNNNSGTITNQTSTYSEFDSRDLELLRKIKKLGFDDFCEVANFINNKIK